MNSLSDRRLAAAIAIPGLLALAIAMSGCSNVRNALGYNKQAPDEFAVLSRAPLSLPPAFGLRPPAPGAERPQEPSVRDGARDLLVTKPADPQDVTAHAGETSGETALKSRLAIGETDPDIREVVNRESTTFVPEDTDLIDRLLFWRDKPEPGLVVDAAKEQERLQRNAELGKPATEDETPVIRQKRGGLFDRLF